MFSLNLQYAAVLKKKNFVNKQIFHLQIIGKMAGST